jgi:Asp-tRNA(Asn)/Glu-tRNA(Gln) amidotransferase B subunit
VSELGPPPNPEPTPEALEAMCRRVLEEHPNHVAAYRGGQSALGFFVGSVMSETLGAANPRQVAETFLRLLETP